MHLLKHKTPKDKPFINVHSHWEVPEYRRLRGRRYNADGKFIGVTGLKNRFSESEQRAVRAAAKAASKLPPPRDTDGFDLRAFTPLTGRVLVRRPPPITEEKGVKLPETKWRSPQHFEVVAVGPGVLCCQAGDHVVFQKGHRPKELWLGTKFYMGRAACVAAILT